MREVASNRNGGRDVVAPDPPALGQVSKVRTLGKGTRPSDLRKAAPGSAATLTEGLTTRSTLLMANPDGSRSAGHSLVRPQINQPPGIAPVIERGHTEAVTPARGPGKSKRPRACHTIDYNRDEQGTWAICGYKFRVGPTGKVDHGGAHSREACIGAGHRRCKRCAVIRKSEGDWG